MTRRDKLNILEVFIWMAVIMFLLSLCACEKKAQVLQAFTYTRMINGHRYIIADVDVGVSIIHDLSCPAPDSTHVQKVKIVPR